MTESDSWSTPRPLRPLFDPADRDLYPDWDEVAAITAQAYHPVIANSARFRVGYDDVDVAVERATTVFWQRGFAETSLDALCAATGLGRGSLHGTFDGKGELFRRALDRYGAEYGSRTTPRSTRTPATRPP